ncbi:MAG: cysteine peptidase family C39 domain-containing protein, partial [Verrucomicrobiota bacterium]
MNFDTLSVFDCLSIKLASPNRSPQKMNPNWLGVVSAILAFAVFFIVYRVAKDAPAKTRIILALCATAAAIPGASFAVYYAHIFREPSWYYQFRSITGTELLIIILGIAGGFVATLLPRVLLVLPLLGVAAFSVAPIIKPFIGPISAGSLQDKWDGEVCLQSTPSTCGAASTATLLNQLGVDVTESDLAAEAHSYVGGTEAWYLARAARSRGFEVDFVFTAGFTPEEGLPAVVG